MASKRGQPLVPQDGLNTVPGQTLGNPLAGRCSRFSGNGWYCNNATEGGYSWCDRCRQVQAAYKAAHREKYSSFERRARAVPAVAFAKSLTKNCGMLPEQAHMVGVELAKPDQKCFYCGCPQWLIYRLRAEGRVLPGGNRYTRLTLEHRQPAIRTNHITLACWPCNGYRSNGKYTDEEVLANAREFWNFWVGRKVTYTWLR